MMLGIKPRGWMPFGFPRKSRFLSLHMQDSLEKMSSCMHGNEVSSCILTKRLPHSNILDFPHTNKWIGLLISVTLVQSRYYLTSQLSR